MGEAPFLASIHAVAQPWRQQPSLSIDIMGIIHVAPYVYAVRINMKVHNATLAVTMKCNYILAVFEIGCLCTLALRLS